MTVVNLTNSTTLATNAPCADTLISRLVGLLNRKTLQEGEALLITRCNSIHTFFMRFAIDVVFLKTQMSTDEKTQKNADDRKFLVVKAVSCLKPFRLSFCPGADRVIELPAGTIARTHTQAQDMIYFKYA